MFDRQKLQEIADPQDLTPSERGGKTTAIKEGYRYYGRLKKTFPAHYMSFRCMLRRTYTPNCYSRTPESFIDFILDIGPVPENIIRPTVGRIDHSQGYFPGNFEWQSHKFNSSEPMQRKIDRKNDSRNKY